MLDTRRTANQEHHPSLASQPKKRPTDGQATWAAQAIRGVDLSLREAHMSRHANRPVSEIMSKQMVTFTADTTLTEATQVMLSRHISGAPVVDEQRKPIGIVSKTDLLEAWHEAHKSVDDHNDAVVGDIMVPYLLAAQHSSPICLAAALMAFEGVHRLLVLDEQSAMVGIVTSVDILRWLGNLSGFLLTEPGPA